MSTSKTWERIAALELGQVHAAIRRLHGGSWTERRLSAAETWYRRFLYLAALYPDTTLVPSGDIDIFWHAHILHTRQYLRDCNDVLGYFLHHEPADDSDGSTTGMLQKNWQRTLELFEINFGTTPFESSAILREEVGYEAAICNSNCDRAPVSVL
jgi:hypothetical protein